MKGKKKKKAEHFQFSYVIPCDVTNPYDILRYIQLQKVVQDIEVVTPFEKWFAEHMIPKEKG